MPSNESTMTTNSWMPVRRCSSASAASTPARSLRTPAGSVTWVASRSGAWAAAGPATSVTTPRAASSNTTLRLSFDVTSPT
jgi:hypothetical protein